MVKAQEDICEPEVAWRNELATLILASSERKKWGEEAHHSGPAQKSDGTLRLGHKSRRMLKRNGLLKCE